MVKDNTDIYIHIEFKYTTFKHIRVGNSLHSVQVLILLLPTLG